MPVGMIQPRPRSPIWFMSDMRESVEVGFYGKESVQQFLCDWCGQLITAELMDGRLFVSTKGASYTPIRRGETLPQLWRSVGVVVSP